jgi:hypothetical protein
MKENAGCEESEHPEAGENETGALLFFAQDCGNEFVAAKDFDIVDEGNHGVIVKVVAGNMLKDFLGNIWCSDDLDLGVARFRVPGANTPRALAVNGIAGVTGGAQIADFGQEAILDGIVANDDDPLHEHCLHR